MVVNLTYFKLTGKYYGTGELIIDDNEKPLHKIWAEIDALRAVGTLPGMLQGTNFEQYIILVNVPDHKHNHPRLIL